jgi:hypothetical protein
MFFLLVCSSHPRTKYFFQTAHFFTLLVPIVQQPGQAVMLGRLSMFLYFLLVLPVMEEERHRQKGHNDVVELS